MKDEDRKKITFKTNGEDHVLPIDSSKTLRVGSVSPSMKLTAETAGFSIAPQKIVFNQNNQPIMTIHPDGRITLGENAQPTEAAAACIYAMDDMIQNLVRRAVEQETEALSAENERLKRSAEYWEQDSKRYAANQEYWRMKERAAIVAWLRAAGDEVVNWTAIQIEAGEHLK